MPSSSPVGDFFNRSSRLTSSSRTPGRRQGSAKKNTKTSKPPSSNNNNNNNNDETILTLDSSPISVNDNNFGDSNEQQGTVNDHQDSDSNNNSNNIDKNYLQVSPFVSRRTSRKSKSPSLTFSPSKRKDKKNQSPAASILDLEESDNPFCDNDNDENVNNNVEPDTFDISLPPPLPFSQLTTSTPKRTKSKNGASPNTTSSNVERNKSKSPQKRKSKSVQKCQICHQEFADAEVFAAHMRDEVSIYDDENDENAIAISQEGRSSSRNKANKKQSNETTQQEKRKSLTTVSRFFSKRIVDDEEEEDDDDDDIVDVDSQNQSTNSRHNKEQQDKNAGDANEIILEDDLSDSHILEEAEELAAEQEDVLPFMVDRINADDNDDSQNQPAPLTPRRIKRKELHEKFCHLDPNRTEPVPEEIGVTRYDIPWRERKWWQWSPVNNNTYLDRMTPERRERYMNHGIASVPEPNNNNDTPTTTTRNNASNPPARNGTSSSSSSRPNFNSRKGSSRFGSSQSKRPTGWIRGRGGWGNAKKKSRKQ